MRNTWLVSYDISEQNRQTHVRKFLLGHGDPLHYSVYLIHANKIEIQNIKTQLEKLISPDEDRIFLFNCGKDPETILGKIWHIGRPLEKDIFSDMMWIF